MPDRTDLLYHWGIALATGAGVTLLLLIARRFVLRWIEAKSGGSSWLENFLQSLRTPTWLWSIALGMAAGLDVAPLPGRMGVWSSRFLEALVIFSITLIVADTAAISVRRFAEGRQIEAAMTGLGGTLTRIMVFILGGLMILDSLGVAITPLVTALGVGGIAVGLALQDTLANLFAGVHLLIERTVRVGDLVKLETGQEGTVMDIGWRTTRLRMAPDKVVIVPNSKVAQGVLTLRAGEEAEAPEPVDLNVRAPQAEAKVPPAAHDDIGMTGEAERARKAA